MEFEKFKRLCISTSRDQNDYIKEWTDYQTLNTTLEIAPISRFPHLVFNNINETHYEWCGPMLLLAQYFAKFTRCKVRLNPSQNLSLIYKSMFDGTTAIALASMPSYHYVQYVIDKNMDSNVKLSPYIDFTDTSKVLAKTKKGELHFFKQFECFEPEVYYCIIASIIIISLATSLYKESFKAFLINLWSYSSVMVNGSSYLEYSNYFTMILSSIWLLASFILMAAFAGMSRDLLIKPHPIYRIDSWNDLVNWKHLKIQTSGLTDLANFLRKNPDDAMSKELVADNRIEIFTPAKLIRSKHMAFDFDGIANGKVALVAPTHYLHVHKTHLVVRGMEEDIDFHISQYGDPWKSCFVFHSHKNMNRKQIDKLSIGIEMIRESGIYDRLVKVGLNPSRVGPDAGQTQPTTAHEFDTLVIHQMRGIFLLFSILSVVSISMFVIEMRKVISREIICIQRDEEVCT